MSKQPPGIMTPDKYLQTDEQTLLEIAPHWRPGGLPLRVDAAC